MSFASKHTNGTVNFGVDTEGYAFATLKQLYEQMPEGVYMVRGFFINTKSEYGDHPVCISDGMFVDFPRFTLPEVEAILHDSEDIAAIKNGEVGFKVRPFESHGKQCYGVDYVDVPADAAGAVPTPF